MPGEGEKCDPEGLPARVELLGTLLAVHKRLKRTLDLAETHMVEALRLYEESRKLESMALEVSRALCEDPPDTQRDFPAQEEDLDDPW